MSAKPSFIIRIFKWIWNLINFSRKLILNIVFFSFLGLFFIGIAVSVSSDEITLEPGSALVLDLNGTVVEQKESIDALSAVLDQQSANESAEILLSDVLFVIKKAAIDSNIKAIVLNLDKLTGTGTSKLQAIGDALNLFKSTGKPVVAIGNQYNRNQYFLASFADKIYLNPRGAVTVDGLSNYQPYIKSALDKLKVKVHIFRVGTFKSAVEPFMRDSMSEPAKKANLTLLNDIWSSYTRTVAQNRNIAQSDLGLDADTYINALKQADGDTALMAKNLKWVDELTTAEMFRMKMIDLVGTSNVDNSFKQIDFNDYNELRQPIFDLSENANIAIVVAKGEILNGNQPSGTIGGESTSELLRKARFDSQIKAVVLRVDSPGGSAFASEQIRQEVLALKAAGKPVVVSMGSLAASGGYWISADADYIFATPTTLTGSIGIFALSMSFEDSLDAIGIHTDGVSTSDWNSIPMYQSPSEPEKAIYQSQIEHGYKDFLSIVAEGRGMSLSEVDSIAQGRVWSGTRAVQLGLVDKLGDIDDAVAKAAQLAQLKHFDSKVIGFEDSAEEMLLQLMLGSVASYIPQTVTMNPVLTQVFNELNATVQELNYFDDPNGIYLYCEQCRY